MAVIDQCSQCAGSNLVGDVFLSNDDVVLIHVDDTVTTIFKGKRQTEIYVLVGHPCSLRRGKYIHAD